MPKRARGLPDPEDYGDLSALSPGEMADWVVQRHLARRAGPHFDVRVGNKDTGMYSWAVPKGLPEPGARHLAVRQPVHSHSYNSFQGTIPRGYGAGEVSTHDRGQALLTDVGADKLHLTTAHKGVPERYVLTSTGSGPGGRNWLLLNTTPTQPVPFTKQHYQSLPQDRAEDVLRNLPQGGVVQPKVDGASILASVLKNRLELTSYRQSKRTGGPIVHTERVFGGRPTLEGLPKELQDSILHGELYGTDAGGAVHPGELGTLLNSSLGKSRAAQKQQGVDLKTMLFDVTRRGGQDVGKDVPYSQRRKWLEEFSPHLPKDKFHLAEEARTPEDALSMWDRVRSGTHPLTREGVVVHPPTGKPQKIKLRDEADVHVHDVFPGEGKYLGVGAGGYQYSLSPGGPPVGKVGTGLSDELRRQMWADPEGYKGRVARLISQEQLPSGAYRAPAHLAFHEDFPLAPAREKESEMSLIDGTLGEAVEALAGRAAELRLRPVTYQEVREKRARDILSSVGRQFQDNPTLASTLLGGVAGAGLGGIGTGISNLGKEKDERRSALGSALTGGLAGAALGGGIGLAGKAMGRLGGPGEPDAMRPGEFNDPDTGTRMRVDPEALKANPELARQARGLTEPANPIDRGVRGVVGGGLSALTRAVPGLHSLTNRLGVTDDDDIIDRNIPFSGKVLPPIAALDFMANSRGLRMGERNLLRGPAALSDLLRVPRLGGWMRDLGDKARMGMVRPEKSTNVDQLLRGISEANKSPSELGAYGFTPPPRGQSNDDVDALLHLAREGRPHIEEMARHGRSVSDFSFPGVQAQAPNPPTPTPRTTRFNEQQTELLKGLGGRTIAGEAGKNKGLGESPFGEPRYSRASWREDTHMPTGPWEGGRGAGRVLLYAGMPLGEYALRSHLSDLERQENMRDLIRRYARPAEGGK